MIILTISNIVSSSESPTPPTLSNEENGDHGDAGGADGGACGRQGRQPGRGGPGVAGDDRRQQGEVRRHTTGLARRLQEVQQLHLQAVCYVSTNSSLFVIILFKAQSS